ncbi:hypothetical protein [Bradyrhizobium sp. 87]|uniref:hypothetical protein n=1 Tax=Bradyrhizobium sp. 87 TaxID=2782682 RepID=UPI001FF87318|nr:hypothetical protein [Bradyrhizobium sp. 87]MCK1430924.1 hypothetical protein [Bradyrhizobium sp. 87]
MSEQHIAFKEALARHYKAGREQAETCLGDIIQIVGDETMPEAEQVEKILDRLIQHYSHDQ